VYPDNLHELDKIAELLIEKGMQSWRLFRIFPSGRADNNENVLLSFEQTQEMINWIAKNKNSLQKKGLTLNLSCEGWLPYSIDKTVRDAPFFCRAGINMASILSDGTITGCSNNHPEFYEGNILKDNFESLWEFGFQKFRKRSWLSDTVCAECKHVSFCQGGSIHLWNPKNDRPNFCYVKDIGKIK